jgi:hypothetical protein
MDETPKPKNKGGRPRKIKPNTDLRTREGRLQLLISIAAEIHETSATRLAAVKEITALLNDKMKDEEGENPVTTLRFVPEKPSQTPSEPPEKPETPPIPQTTVTPTVPTVCEVKEPVKEPQKAHVEVKGGDLVVEVKVEEGKTKALTEADL